MLKKIKLDEIVFLLMLFQITIGSYLGLLRRLNPVIVFIILIMLIRQYKKAGRLIKFLVPLIVFYILYFFNIMFSNGHSMEYARRNLLVLTYPMIQVFYFTLLSEKGMMKEILKKYYSLFNMLAIVSIIVGYMQYLFPGTFSAVNSTGKINTFLGDDVYGIFGYGQQHTFGLYLIFVLLQNFQEIKKRSRSKTRLKVLSIGMLVASSALFVMADNKAYFILLPLSLFVYLIYDYLQKDAVSKKLKVWGRFLGILFLISVLYFVIPGVHSFLKNNVISTFEKAVYAINMGNEAYGTTERIAIIFWALRRPETWQLGLGYDQAMLFEGNNFLGFAHFGQADMGSLLVLGGIWMTIALIVYVYRCFNRMATGSIHVSFECHLSLMLYIIILLVYTQLFSRVDNMMCIIMFICLLQSCGGTKGIRAKGKGLIQ